MNDPVLFTMPEENKRQLVEIQQNILKILDTVDLVSTTSSTDFIAYVSLNVALQLVRTIESKTESDLDPEVKKQYDASVDLILMSWRLPNESTNNPLEEIDENQLTQV